MKKQTVALAISLACLATFTADAQITNPAPYCAATFVTNYNMFNNIKVKGMALSFGVMGNWMPANNNTYKYYNTTTFPNLKKADTFSVQVNVFSVDDIEPAYFALWIDYNHNNAFDDSELVMQNSNTIKSLLPAVGQAVTPINKILTVPMSTMTGVTRARLMRGYNTLNAYDPYDPSYSLAPCTVTTTSTSSYGCTYDFNLNIVAGSSTDVAETRSAIGSIEIYPNPATSQVIIKGDLNGAKVTMTDIYGHDVDNFFSAENRINVSALVPGIYILHIANGQQVTKTKLVIGK